MLTNPLTQQMVIADDLRKQAEEVNTYFQTMLANQSNIPNVEQQRNMGFSSAGDESLASQLKLTLEQARIYEHLQMRFPGYLIVHKKHLLAWTLIHGLYVGEHYQFTGLIPELNQDHIVRFNNLLTWEDVRLEYKATVNNWKPIPDALLKSKVFRNKLDVAKSQGLHTANGVRINFGQNSPIRSGRSYVTDANVRALPGYKMIADFKFFNKAAFLTDSAKAATYYTPDPDPLVLLEKGDFQIIVTAWGHEEQLLPDLKKLAGTTI